jgi:hypothetical protein
MVLPGVHHLRAVSLEAEIGKIETGHGNGTVNQIPSSKHYAGQRKRASMLPVPRSLPTAASRSNLARWQKLQATYSTNG